MKNANFILSALEGLQRKVDRLEQLMTPHLNSEKDPDDQWLTVDDLCKYHPSHPSKSTVYKWVGQGLIPFHKTGKKLMFLKSEINNWMRYEN